MAKETVSIATSEDLYFQVTPWKSVNKLQLSNFDLLLRSKWQDVLDSGLFLHKIESEPSRIPGEKGYVGVLCRNRASHKRKAQSFTNIIQKQDLNSFNFTKVKSEELLFTMEMVSDAQETLGEENKKPSCHIFINNSPYEYGHSLLVPEPQKLHVQSIDLKSIRFGIEMLLRSSHPGFRVMYNSLLGGASVNHLHLHCYYTEYWLNSEAFNLIPLTMRSLNGTIKSEKAIPNFYEIDRKDSVVPGFGFTITKNNYCERLPLMIHKITVHLVEKNIAHNIVLIRGVAPTMDRDVSNGKDDQPNTVGGCRGRRSELGIPLIQNDSAPYYPSKDIDSSIPLIGRVYIFPRKPIMGEKCYKKFLVNVTELFGHLYFGDVSVFEKMTEKEIIKAFKEISLTEVEFSELKTTVTELVQGT